MRHVRPGRRGGVLPAAVRPGKQPAAGKSDKSRASKGSELK